MNQYNLKSIREDFKKKGIYYTPPELKRLMLSYVDIEPETVYDPTCGDGGLLWMFPNHVKKYGQEINQHQIDIAQLQIPNFIGHCGDTLQEPAFKEMKFDCIMANPPFSIEWNPIMDERFQNAPTIPTKSRADYAFILHILHYLKEDGIAVVLAFPGILYRGNREKTIRQWIVEQNYIEKIVHIPPDTFVDTKIATVLLVLRKNKKNTNILFRDTELNVDRVVSLKEIQENDYALNVSTYIQKEHVKEYIDTMELQRKARAAMLQRIKRDIEFDQQVCELEGWSTKAYLQSIIKLVKEYQKKNNQEQIKGLYD